VARARYPAANHAAEPIVIFDLQRPGRFEASIAAPAPIRPQASTGPSMPAAVRGLTGLGAQASEAAVRSVHGSGSSE
jgi:hypothetical protein